ncbi:MAG: GNAT family N-acetyltransferase [Bacteroidetes bacterium]|nr:MAG: GNAT family N-acetyltransferase [Bacteroidota bacterium]
MILIRKATQADLSQLAELFNLYRIFYRKESDIDGARKFLGERMDANESIIFVATEGENLVGFTQLYPLFSSTRMKRTWLLNDLFVLEEFRGRGISKELIEMAKQLATETESAGLLLETEKTNVVGNNLYPSAGFVPNSRTNFYWWENKAI